MKRLLALLAVVLLAGTADAAPIAAFSGNTQPFKPASAGGPDGGTVNFAVYDRTGGTAGDPFGTGVAGLAGLFTPASSSPSATLDTSAAYLYLFQTVANSPTGESVFQNSVGIVPSTRVTSAGEFTGTDFSGVVLGAPAGFANPSPASTGVAPVILTGQAGLITPTTLTLGASSLLARYFVPAELLNGQQSILFGYTSNFVPTFGSTAILETTGANGTVPTPSATPAPPVSPAGPLPEPATLVVFGLMVGVGGLAARGRKATA